MNWNMPQISLAVSCLTYFDVSLFLINHFKESGSVMSTFTTKNSNTSWFSKKKTKGMAQLTSDFIS